MTDTGWHLPSAVYSAQVTNPGNALTSDDSYATRTGVSDGKEEPSGQLLLKGFGFAIPENHIILGVEAKVEGKKSGTVREQSLRLSLNGTSSVGQQKGSSVVFGSVDTESIAGGPADLWGLALTPADVNSPNFGIDYRGRMYSSSTWYIDTMSLKVYHELSAVNEFEVSGQLDIVLSSSGRRSNAYRRSARLVRSIFPQRFSRR